MNFRELPVELRHNVQMQFDWWKWSEGTLFSIKIQGYLASCCTQAQPADSNSSKKSEMLLRITGCST